MSSSAVPELTLSSMPILQLLAFKVLYIFGNFLDIHLSSCFVSIKLHGSVIARGSLRRKWWELVKTWNSSQSSKTNFFRSYLFRNSIFIIQQWVLASYWIICFTGLFTVCGLWYSYSIIIIMLLYSVGRLWWLPLTMVAKTNLVTDTRLWFQIKG
mgnify:CR=1 FL=1